jgi:hypothetical protein
VIFTPGPSWTAFVLQPSEFGVKVYALREPIDSNSFTLRGHIIAFTTSIESARATLPVDAKQSHGAIAKSLPKGCELWLVT